MQVFEIRRIDCGTNFCVYRAWKDVEAEFDGAEVGDSILVTLSDMSQEELDNLPDFAGW
jgi:hypothetical protein